MKGWAVEDGDEELFARLRAQHAAEEMGAFLARFVERAYKCYLPTLEGRERQEALAERRDLFTPRPPPPIPDP